MRMDVDTLTRADFATEVEKPRQLDRATRRLEGVHQSYDNKRYVAKRSGVGSWTNKRSGESQGACHQYPRATRLFGG